MREDILNKKKEMIKYKGSDIKVELVGLPSFMQSESSFSED